ncbi:MAG: lysine--tRNA ligase [Chloroflexota bacterium]|nr:lysine--tRNA ligase [Dehalococcoidia bacterium]MDW8254683.1 lysine--tRNA ligase [Chloroflexota bacterium]
MSDVAEQIAQRRAKVAAIRAGGGNPYPARFRRTHTAAEAVAAFEADPDALIPVTVAGRLISKRVMGKATFAHLQDWSGRIQLFARRDSLGDAYDSFLDFDLGDIVGIEGTLMRTRTGEITVDVGKATLLAKSLRPLPDKWHGLTDVEKRYRQRYLDLIANEETRRIVKLRQRVVSAIRRFLDARGFVEVETPVLQLVPGGAAARSFKTYYEALDTEVHLRISLELYLKRLLVGGLDKVYELGRVFRNEGISHKHNPEFTLLETYEAYADYLDVLTMVEELLATVVRDVHGSLQVDLGEHTIDFTPPWRRETLRDAIRSRAGIDFADYPDAESLRAVMRERGLAVDPTLGRGKLIDELLTTFVEPTLIQPTFLLDYPVELSPLAKRKEDDPTLVERFEGFVGGIEIANAFSELNDPDDQRARFEAQLAARAAGDEETERLDEDFLLALEYGMPPAGGLGIGIDRLVALLAGAHSLREVILFPQLRTVR